MPISGGKDCVKIFCVNDDNCFDVFESWKCVLSSILGTQG